MFGESIPLLANIGLKTVTLFPQIDMSRSAISKLISQEVVVQRGITGIVWNMNVVWNITGRLVKEMTWSVVRKDHTETIIPKFMDFGR